jgi:hypothetical protein
VALTVQGVKGKPSPAVVTIDASGKVQKLDLSKSTGSAAITDAPKTDASFWRDLPQQTLTVTDMRFYQGKLYVAGLSNRQLCLDLAGVRLSIQRQGAGHHHRDVPPGA